MATRRFGRGFSFNAIPLWATIGFATIAGFLLFGTINAPLLRAQTSDAADWQKAAGGKMSFEVESVKQNVSGDPVARAHANFPLDSGDSYSQNGGLLCVVNFPVGAYIGFAYKLSPSENRAVSSQLPGWATREHFDIEAHGATGTTKDQMRLMMQSLLADRFKLAVHMETKDGPVLAVLLVHPGKTGPQLEPHSDNPPCADFTPPAAGAAPTPSLTSGGLPMRCEAITIQLGGVPPNNHPQMVARNVTIQQIADALSTIPAAGFDRPLVDETGLSGRFDFTLSWTPLPGPGAPPDTTGPIFIENMKDQLGLKLEARSAPIRRLVIDHIEEPSPN